MSQRLEGIEDAVDRLDERLASIDSQVGEVAQTMSKPQRQPKAKSGEAAPSALETRLDEIARDLAALRDAVAPGSEPPPRAQERLTVTES